MKDAGRINDPPEHMIGAKAVNALSKRTIVTTANEGKKEFVTFEKGNFISYAVEKSDEYGVEVTFYPDEKIFETVTFDSQRIENMLLEFSFLCQGLKFIFIDEIKGIKKELYSENGLYDYINFLNKKDNFLFTPIHLFAEEGQFKVEVAFAYNTSYTSTVRLYTNNIPQEKGTHLTGFKFALTKTLNTFAKEKKLLKDKEEGLTSSDLEEGQILILNFKMIDPVFKGQNKEELSSSEGRTYVQRLLSKSMDDWFKNHEKDAKKIFDKAITARKAKEAAKRARDKVRKPKETGLKAKMILSTKFTDCISKNPKERNLLLVEGNSAAGSAIESRNVYTDCIYALRGKIISPLKQTVDKILANQEISDIVNVIGAGFGNDKFDMSKMKFDKIVITADQDSDGMAIELLLITFFYTFMRPLVEAGKLYRAVTPLYIVKTKSEKYYCYTEEELEKWKATHKISYELSHCKGLSEVSPQVLKEICFEKQRFKRIIVSDAQKTVELLETLEGKNVSPRKQYIYDNAEKLGFNFV